MDKSKDHDIANILYNACLDMDYADYIEYADYEINYLAAEISKARDLKLESLINVLEVLSDQNINLKNWHLEVERI